MASIFGIRTKLSSKFSKIFIKANGKTERETDWALFSTRMAVSFKVSSETIRKRGSDVPMMNSDLLGLSSTKMISHCLA